MKKLIASVLLLAIGFGLGWYFGYTRPAATADREVRQQVQAIEVDDCSAALFALKAIPVVESGDIQKAIERLAKPIGNYYRIYASHAGTNEQRLRLRAMIEHLASTNQLVAAEINRKIE